MSIYEWSLEEDWRRKNRNINVCLRVTEQKLVNRNVNIISVTPTVQMDFQNAATHPLRPCLEAWTRETTEHATPSCRLGGAHSSSCSSTCGAVTSKTTGASGPEEFDKQPDISCTVTGLGNHHAAVIVTLFFR